MNAGAPPSRALALVASARQANANPPAAFRLVDKNVRRLFMRRL
jgi:hypothetical protein